MSRGDSKRAFGALFGSLRGLLSLRWVRVLTILVLVALGLRVSLNSLLATTVRKLAAGAELDCTWQGLDLSLLGGRGTLRGLRVEPLREEGAPTTGEPLVELEYATFDLEVSALLTGELRVRRAEVDGFDARLARDAAGRWNFEPHLEALLRDAEPAPEADEGESQDEPDEPRPLDLSLPIEVEALRFQHARLTLVDEGLGTPLELGFELNAALSHLGDRERPARFSVTVTGGEALDGARIEGVLRSSAERLSLELEAQAGGLRPGLLAPYLALVDLRPAAQSIEASCRFEAELEVAGAARDALRAGARLSEVRLRTDGGEALALDALELGAEHLGADGARFAPLELRSPRARVELRADGALRVAGLDYVPGLARETAWARRASSADGAALSATQELATGSDAAQTTASVDPAAADGPTEDAAGAALPWSFAGLRIEGGGLELIDRSTRPAAELSLVIEVVELGEVAFVPGAPPRPVSLDVRLAAPGVCESIHLGGELQPLGPARSLALELELAGLGLEAIDPYLAGVGVERVGAPGALRLEIDATSHTEPSGRITAQLELGEVVLGEEGELFGLRAVSLRDLVIDPDERLVRVGELVADGTRLSVERDLTRNFVGFGLRVLGSGALAQAESKPNGAAGAPPAEDEATGTATEDRPARIELGRVAWTGSQIAFVDRGFVDRGLVDRGVVEGGAESPTRIELSELGFELENLVLGGAVGDAEAPPASFRAQLASEGVVDSLALEGSIRSRPGPLDLEASLILRGENLRGERLRPYLEALGLVPLLAAGELRLDLNTRVRQAEDGLHADLELRDVLLAEGGSPLVALEELALAGLVLGDEGLAIEELRVAAPRAWVRRNAEGAIEVAGLRLGVDAPVAPAAEAAALESPAEPGAPATPAHLVLPELPALRLGLLDLTGLELVFDDASFEPELSLGLALDARLRDLDTTAGTGEYELRLAVADALDELSVRGDLSLSSEAMKLQGVLGLRGLRGGPLARFLPEGLALECEAGELESVFRVVVEPAPEGGLALRAQADRTRWGEPGAEPWFGCREAYFAAPRIDPLAERFVVGPLRVEGTTLSARRDADGALHAFGVALGAPTQALTDERDPVIAREPIEASAPLAADATEEPVRAPSPPPHLELVEGLSLELERLIFSDASLGADARPLVTAVQLELEPCQLLAPDPGELAPIAWSVGGAVEGLVREWRLAGSIAPFAPEPRLVAKLSAEGLRTAGACELVPALARSLEGELEEGRLTAELEALLFVRRTRPWELGLERAFSAEASLTELHFLDATGGEVLVGVDAVRLDAKRVHLGKGLAHLSSVEIETPRLRARKDAEALHVLGFALPLGGEPAASETAASEPMPEPEPEVAAGEPVEAGFELTIDRVALSGLDVLLEDVSIDPPLHLPLDSLEAELRRFSTRRTDEPRAMPFDLYLGTSAAEGEKPLFEELVLSGRVALQPAPSGRARLQIEGLELANLAGLTAAQGIEIDDGALDTSVRVELRGEEGLGVGTELVFSDLALAEPEGGFIEQHLSLPMSLDAALFLLRNPAGEHRLALDVDMGADGLSAAEIALAGSRALAEVLGVALAGAPLRVVTAFVPKGGDEGPTETLHVRFEPGNTRPAARELALLREASRKLAGRDDYVLRLTHEPGAADLVQAERLANPEPADCLALTAQLRQRRTQLWHQVEGRQLEARALYAVGAPEAGGASEELRVLQRELAGVERSLDEVLEVLRSSSPRQRQKRARLVARDLGLLRLEEVADSLRSGLRGYDSIEIETTPVRVREASIEGPSQVVIEFLPR